MCSDCLYLLLEEVNKISSLFTQKRMSGGVGIRDRQITSKRVRVEILLDWARLTIISMVP